MSFVHRRIKTEGMTLIGPGDHTGEERFHWVNKPAGRYLHNEPAGRSEELVLRIEKLNGISKEYDPFSPLVSLQFRAKTVLVSCIGHYPNSSKVSCNLGTINPYLNTVQSTIPRFEIPFRSLDNTQNEVEVSSSFLGDFLIMKNAMHGTTQLNVLNLSSLGLFSGIDFINAYGRFLMDRKVIGRSGDALRSLYTSESVQSSEAYGYKNKILQNLYRKAMELMSNHGPGYTPRVCEFAVIDWSMNSDRPSITKSEGINRAKALFEKLFTAK